MGDIKIDYDLLEKISAATTTVDMWETFSNESDADEEMLDDPVYPFLML